MFSARFMEADEAHGMGLINFIEPSDNIEAACLAYAERIAGNAPLTIKATKAALNTWEAGSEPEAVNTVRDMVDACFNSEDYKEGRSAFAAKRPPKFQGN